MLCMFLLLYMSLKKMWIKVIFLAVDIKILLLSKTGFMKKILYMLYFHFSDNNSKIFFLIDGNIYPFRNAVKSSTIHEYNIKYISNYRYVCACGCICSQD